MLSCVQVSPDGRHVVAVSEPGNLLIFDVASLSKHLHKVSTSVYCVVERFDGVSP